MVYDDYIFIEKYGVTLEGIGLWFLWYFVYFLGFALCFWVISAAIILIYYQSIKRTEVG